MGGILLCHMPTFSKVFLGRQCPLEHWTHTCCAMRLISHSLGLRAFHHRDAAATYAPLSTHAPCPRLPYLFSRAMAIIEVGHFAPPTQTPDITSLSPPGQSSPPLSDGHQSDTTKHRSSCLARRNRAAPSSSHHPPSRTKTPIP